MPPNHVLEYCKKYNDMDFQIESLWILYVTKKSILNNATTKNKK